ncbi:hypothetical protein [Thermosyntropha sp.]|uniref:gp33 family protein n=1 Tax=Thermosyntropha sp. TaxID=2740820 RepID=UPI0025F72FC0|nr:hypothetical protein [Thermosyntropha sp.]MBO8158848.1 hypothetical protein [Thermosyntropha sp.]
MENLMAIAEKLAELRKSKKVLEETLKEINREISQVESDLVSKMIEEEMSSFTRGNKQFVLQSKTYVSAKSGMMPVICTWMKENGLKDMVKETIHPQTLQAWVKEKLEEESLPEELKQLLNIYEKNVVAIRKK